MEKSSLNLYGKSIMFALCVMSFMTILSSCSEEDEFAGSNSSKERLVASWTLQGASNTHVSYDEMKRPTKIGFYRLYYNFKEEDLDVGYDKDIYKIFRGKNLALFPYGGGTCLFKINKQGYITNINSGNFSHYKGGSMKYIPSDSTIYIYKDGYLTDIKSYVFDSESNTMKEIHHSILKWANGNLVRFYTEDGKYDFNLGYSNKENKSQIYPIFISNVDGDTNDSFYHYIFGGTSFMALSNVGLFGKVSKNLMIQKTITYAHSYSGTTTYEYELDEKGYVSSYVVTDEKYNKSAKVSFFYQ